VEEVRDPGEVGYRNDLDALDQDRLGRVLRRDDQAPIARFAGAQGGTEGATARAQRAAQRELSADRAVRHDVRRDLLARGEDRHGDSKVEARTGLPEVRRREVDREPLLGKREARVEQRRPNPLSRLAYRAVREAHEHERG
jgi:hypothetical protein